LKHLLVFLLFSFSLNINAQNADDILGVWWDEEKEGQIEIYKKNGKYYGKIVWLEEPYENGKPIVDSENPNAELRDQPILGLVILSDLEFDGEEWDDGNVYDPNTGDTYSCYLALESKNRLKLRGYLGFSLVGRSSYWTRVEQ